MLILLVTFLYRRILIIIVHALYCTTRSRIKLCEENITRIILLKPPTLFIEILLSTELCRKMYHQSATRSTRQTKRIIYVIGDQQGRTGSRVAHLQKCILFPLRVCELLNVYLRIQYQALRDWIANFSFMLCIIVVGRSFCSNYFRILNQL